MADDVTREHERWIYASAARGGRRLRLFCLPYAGGGASIYRKWSSAVPRDIEVCPVQLPGREERIGEAPFTRTEPLIEALAEALVPYLDLPFAFFGHSMGALIAYETIHRLRQTRGLDPAHLLVSGRRAPHIPPDPDSSANLTDREFVAKLHNLKGTPPQVLENRELMGLLLPVMRADFKVNNFHTPLTRPPLDCPVTIFGGLEDEEGSGAKLEDWKEVTRGRCRLKMFPGDHFYVVRHSDELIEYVCNELRG